MGVLLSACDIVWGALGLEIKQRLHFLLLLGGVVRGRRGEQSDDPGDVIRGQIFCIRAGNCRQSQYKHDDGQKLARAHKLVLRLQKRAAFRRLRRPAPTDRIVAAYRASPSESRP